STSATQVRPGFLLKRAYRSPNVPVMPSETRDPATTGGAVLARGIHKACAVCLADDSWRLFQRQGLWIRECACGHRFTEAEVDEGQAGELYSDAYFFEGGDGYPDYLAEGAIIRDQGRFYGRMLRRYGNPGRVLDVGAAAGFLLEGLQDCGWSGVGIEPNVTMVNAARSRGVPVQVGTLERF